ncbi:crossover junction endonuclease EME1 [Lepisosteus oculatus]|uniref:crossover junction endonuclease EME1 n=1 Tax=Lepisosteus oculatus TaxID=7918 RepID=UPI003717B353
MGGSRQNSEHSDTDSSSDLDDLPVFDFLQPRPTLACRSGYPQKPLDVVILDSSDSEPPDQDPESALPVVLHSAQEREVTMISSGSEEEEEFVPLLERLKGHFRGTASAACPVQSEQDSAGGTVDAQYSLKSSEPSFPQLPPPTSTTGLQRASVWDFSDSEEENTAPDSKKPNLGSHGPGRHRFPSSVEWADRNISPLRKKAVKHRQEEIDEARAVAVERRKGKERQKAERENRKQELERQRAERKALADAVKALRPEECMKHMVVTIDPALLQLEGGGSLLTSLQALGCSCAIERQVVARSVTWRRRLPSSQGLTGELDCVSEPHAVIHVPVEDFIRMVHSTSQVQRGAVSGCGPTLISWSHSIVEQITGSILTLAVIDLEQYFRSQKSKNQKKYRNAVSGEGQEGASKRRKKKEDSKQLVEVSRVDVEEALVDLQLHSEVQVRFLESWKEFSDYIAMFTKAVAEAPFKRERDQTSFGFCLESEWAGGHRVERTGKGLVQVWKRQIQQLNRVSPEIASAVLAAYPSPQLLTKAYQKCKTERERHNLLSDILVRRGEGVTSTSRRVGPELSKRICLLMTSPDPNLSLETTG